MVTKKSSFEQRLHRWRRRTFARLDSPWVCFLAWCDMLLFDHGFIRLVYSNRHQLAPGVERSSHPSPGQIAAAARRGIKTIINLRGDTPFGTYALEKRACATHHIKLIDFRMKSRQLPTREKILAAQELFNRIEYPVLLHCKSGADRAGIMSALFCILRLEQPVEQAKQQLSMRFGHFRAAKTGVLDFFFSSFLASGESSFIHWVKTSYQPRKLEQAFRPNGWVAWYIDMVLRRE